MLAMKASKFGETPLSDSRRRNTAKSRYGSNVFREIIPSPHPVQVSKLSRTKKNFNEGPDSSLRDVTPKVCSSVELYRPSSPLENQGQSINIHRKESLHSSTHLLESSVLENYYQSVTAKKRPANFLKNGVETRLSCDEPVKKKQKGFSLFWGNSSSVYDKKGNVVIGDHLPNETVVSPFGFLKRHFFDSFFSTFSVPRPNVSFPKRFRKIQNPFLFSQDRDQQDKSPSFTRPLAFNLSKPFSDKPLSHHFVTTTLTSNVLPFYTRLPDLASEELGARVLYCTDNFFSAAENLLKSSSPQKNSNGYIDGWETRRKKSPGHNWCLIQLGIPGRVYGVELNTRYLDDSYAPYVSVEAANIPNLESDLLELFKQNGFPNYQPEVTGGDENSQMESVVNMFLKKHVIEDPSQWRDIVPMYPLHSSDNLQASRHFSGLSDKQEIPTVTHIRVNLFPDGGLSRLRVYGIGACKIDTAPLANFASVSYGAVVISCSNDHKASCKHLLLNTPPLDMSDGWLTSRNPGRHPFIEAPSASSMPNLVGEHWVIVKLANRVSNIERIDVDTTHYIGNYPNAVEIQVADVSDHIDFSDIEAQQQFVLSDGTNDALWTTIIPQTSLHSNRNHQFCVKDFSSKFSSSTVLQSEIETDEPSSLVQSSNAKTFTTHVKMIISPDGGVSRLRVWCRVPFIEKEGISESINFFFFAHGNIPHILVSILFFHAKLKACRQFSHLKN